VGLLLGWSALFYLFGALLLPWQEQTGLSKRQLSLGLTVAVLTSALMAPITGRLIDGGYGRLVLSGGALVGALGLAGLSLSEGYISFVLAWVVIGSAQGACLFEPTFSFLARVLRQRARYAITLVGLVGGLATLLAYPSLALLTELYSWRVAVGGFALMTAVLTAPLMYAGGALLEPASLHLNRKTRQRAGRLALAAAKRRLIFWILLACFALLAFAEGMTLSHAVPALVEFGQSDVVALISMALVGLYMAAARLGLLWYKPDGSSCGLLITATFTVAAGIALMPLAGEHTVIGPSAMLLFGLGYGMVIVLKPVLISECLGYVSIGSILGALALPCFAALATAPYVGALLWERGGYALAIPVAALAAGAATLGLVLVVLIHR
jgi:MFS family permease